MQLLLAIVSNVFMAVLNMSITASIIIAFVFLARFCLKRVPRSFSYALWAVVLFRLLCPISFALPFAAVGVIGVLPANETQGSAMQYLFPADAFEEAIQSEDNSQKSAHWTDRFVAKEQNSPVIQDGVDVSASIVDRSTAQADDVELREPNGADDTNYSQTMQSDKNAMQAVFSLGAALLGNSHVLRAISLFWLTGALALAVVNGYSLFMLKYRLRNAVRYSLAENRGVTAELNAQKQSNKQVCIYQSDAIPTAFVLGVLRPCIYLPAHLSQKEQSYILQHEQTHIARFDPLWQALAFLALCLHWFNPLVWFAHKASKKDMELSCDERVLHQMGSEIKKEYAQSLLNLSQGRNAPVHHVLAFGESSAKSRIKNVLSYRKPAFWVSLVASIALVMSAVLLLANPMPVQQVGGAANDLANSLQAQQVVNLTPTPRPQENIKPVQIPVQYGTIEIAPTERETLFSSLETIESLAGGQLSSTEAVLVYATANEAVVLVPFADVIDGKREWVEIALAKQGDTWQTASIPSEDDFGVVYSCDADQDAATQLWTDFVRNGQAPYKQYRQYISDVDGDGVDEIFGLVTSSSNTAEPVPCVLWCYHDRTYEKIGEVTVCDLGVDAQNQGEDAPYWMTVGTRKLFTLYEGSGFATWANVYTVQDGEVISFEGIGQTITQGDEALGENVGDFTIVVGAYDMSYMPNATNDDLLYTGHSYKPYYLYWDEENCIFREYGAVEISREAFCALEGANDVLAKIEATSETAYTLDEIYRFANGKYKINYHSGNEEVGACYYIALSLENGVLVDETPWDYEENTGFYLPAIYPEVAVYLTVSQADVPLESDLFQRKAMACVNTLNECYDANFTAQWDENAPLRAGFVNEEYHSSHPDILFPAQNIEQYRDEYYLDIALTDYYLVTNYQTIAELNDALLQYLSQDVIDGQFLTSNFIEYEGALYLVRGATGYGACHIDVESFKAIKYENNQYYTTVDTLWFDERTETLGLTFEYMDGKLILISQSAETALSTPDTTPTRPTVIHVPAAEIETLLLDTWHEASPDEMFRKASPDAKCTVSDLDQDGNQETWFLVEDYNRVVALVIEAQPDGSFIYLGMTDNLWQYDGEASTSLQLYQGDGQTVAYAQCVRSGAVAAAGVQTYDVFVTIEDDVLISNTIYYSSLTGAMEDVDGVVAQYHLDLYSGEAVSKETYLAQRKTYLCGASVAENATVMAFTAVENYESAGAIHTALNAAN